MIEERAHLLGRTQPLVGVVSLPPGGGGSLGAVILNAGIVHRVGTSRLGVRLARRLAAAGLVAVRFDHAGIGDSEPREDFLPAADAAVPEVREVMDDLERRYGCRRFVVIGLCSGAVTAFHAADSDGRVVGAVMINGQGYVPDPRFRARVATQTAAQRYWRKSLTDPDAWKRLLTGRIQYLRLAVVMGAHLAGRLHRPAGVGRAAQDAAARIATVAGRGAHLLLIQSAGDHAVNHLRAILGDRLEPLRQSGGLRTLEFSGTDHSFTLLPSQHRLIDAIDAWTRTIPAAPPPLSPPANVSPMTPAKGPVASCALADD